MEQLEKNIGTETYLVTQMDAIRALKVQTKLIKILGTGIFSLMGKADADISEKIAALIPKLVENFDDKFATALVISLFEKGVFTRVDGVPKVVDFATHFTGKPMEMWKVVAFILEANFAGELSGSSLPTTKEVD